MRLAWGYALHPGVAWDWYLFWLSGKLEVWGRGSWGGAVRFGVEVARLCEKDEGMWFLGCSLQAGIL